MSQLKIGVVGYGNWGKNHVRVLSELDHLGGVYDEYYNIENSTENIKFYNSLEELINNVDGLIISSPANTHFEIAKKALEKIDVLIEKPIAMKTSDVINLQELEQKYENLILVGHQLHFHPAIIKMEALINGGEIGNLKWIYSNRLNMGKIRPNENVLWSFAPHDISMILSLSDSEPSSVNVSFLECIQDDIADLANIHLKFHRGLKADISVSWIHPQKEQKLVITGEKGIIVFDDTRTWDEKVAIYKPTINVIEGIPNLEKSEVAYKIAPQSEPLRNECIHFIDVVNKQISPLTDGCEGLRVLKILEAASLSKCQNNEIKIG
mgnify:CR=1 FL=1